MTAHPRFSAAAAILAATFTFLAWRPVALAQEPAPQAQPASGETQAPPAEAAQAETPTSAPSDADVNAMVASVSDDIGELSEPSLRFYGFADFGVTAHVNDKLKINAANEGYAPRFMIGDLNLYADADLTGGWHSLFEVRFTYIPNGEVTFTGDRIARTSTSAGDYTEVNRPVRWGSILIERAYVEYTFNSLLTLRAGHFVTPVGIWNVDHGTPTVIPVRRPYIVAQGLIPTAQTGFEAYGSHTIKRWTLGYHLTLSNGRGQVDTYLDLDKNKAFGGRVYARLDAIGTLTMGVSWYKGRATDAGVALDPDTLVLSKQITSQYDELGYGADVQWEWEGVLLQSEVLANEVTFTKAGRTGPVFPTGNPGLVPDFRRWGMYVLAGYRLPWVGIMPYIEFAHTDSGTTVAALNTPDIGKTTSVRTGLNIRPAANVAIKLEVEHVYLFGTADSKFPPGAGAIDDVNTQIAWSF